MRERHKDQKRKRKAAEAEADDKGAPIAMLGGDSADGGGGDGGSGSGDGGGNSGDEDGGQVGSGREGGVNGRRGRADTSTAGGGAKRKRTDAVAQLGKQADVRRDEIAAEEKLARMLGGA